jgi:hypothetical protein
MVLQELVPVCAQLAQALAVKRFLLLQPLVPLLLQPLVPLGLLVRMELLQLVPLGLRQLAE